MLKPIILSSPFHRAYTQHSELASKHKSTFQPGMADQAPEERGELMIIHYREEEAIYVQAANDRVTIVISTLFSDETDRVFGKVFLQVSSGLKMCTIRPLNNTDVVVPFLSNRNLWMLDEDHRPSGLLLK
jgi:hypothetical protein